MANANYKYCDQLIGHERGLELHRERAEKLISKAAQDRDLNDIPFSALARAYCDKKNLDERSMPGSHWVCRYDGAWHDPLGSNGTDQRAAFVRRVQG